MATTAPTYGSTAYRSLAVQDQLAPGTPRQAHVAYIYQLQDRICQALEGYDALAKFQEDLWDHHAGGGGRTRVIAEGEVFEKGGVNVSEVWGELPAPIRQNFGVEGGWFFAAGLSMVIHPKNPHIPTTHANWRIFELYDAPGGRLMDSWFGGGADLTPYYLVPEDAAHFHSEHKLACDAHHPDFYPRYKAECDAYFWNAHRDEARGVGGLFFDYLRAGQDGLSLEQWRAFVHATADAFLPAYLPLVERHKNDPYNDAQRWWQEVRRGRYVEFNLIHDRGTLFGLKTKGRMESILMSLPPRVRWVYAHEPDAGTPEAALLAVLRQPRPWV